RRPDGLCTNEAIVGQRSDYGCKATHPIRVTGNGTLIHSRTSRCGWNDCLRSQQIYHSFMVSSKVQRGRKLIHIYAAIPQTPPEDVVFSHLEFRFSPVDL